MKHSVFVSILTSSSRNKLMNSFFGVIQGQIKLKETALEASSNMFVEKEKNLKNRIEELETKLDQLNQNSQEVNNNDNQNHICNSTTLEI